MNFTVQSTDSGSSARTGILKTDHGSIETPVFMPVGTVGAVKTMAPHELKFIGSQVILGNTYHLYLRPGIEIINKAGGLHTFSNWDQPILTDSGGFQVFSLAKLNTISDDGVEFQSHLDGSRHTFTPEFSMEIQRKLGADIIMAFDECPPGDADEKIIKDAVGRTTQWMKRCYNWLKDNPELYNYGQTVFPIIQGAGNHSLRQLSAEQLIPYSTCGMAIGGLAVGEEKNVMLDTVEYCHEIGRTYREDSGNYMWRFTRNRVRQDLMPKLAEDYNPQVRNALVRLARTAAEELDFVEQELDKAWSGIAVESNGEVRFSRFALSGLHPLLQRLALRRAYVLVTGDATRLRESHLVAMEDLAAGNLSLIHI